MKILADDRGFSLTEVMVASVVSAIVAAAFVTLFIAFNRTVSNQENRAVAMGELRPSLEQLLVDVRQSVDVDDSGVVIEALNSTWSSTNLVFYSDTRTDSDGPERVRYYLDDCSAQLCVLKRAITLADSGSGPNWTYSSAPSADGVVQNVITGGTDPLFVGVDWTGGVETLVTSCDLSTPCEFDLVRIALRINSDPEFEAGRDVLVIEEARIRNAER